MCVCVCVCVWDQSRIRSGVIELIVHDMVIISIFYTVDVQGVIYPHISLTPLSVMRTCMTLCVCTVGR